jgi:hypothetical protein
MNSMWLLAARVVGHLLIATLCVLAALMLSGRHTQASYTINGVPIERLGQVATVQALQAGGKFVTTTTVSALGHRLDVDGAGVPLLVWPVITAMLLLLIYLPGFLWSAANRLPIRLGLALAIFAAVLSGA